MTAPVPHEVDLWRLIDAEGGPIECGMDQAWSNGIKRALSHVDALGYSEGIPVPTAAHYAALKEERDRLEAALRLVRPAVEAALAELQETWGDDEGDEPALLDALVVIDTALEPSK
jgi:hypothetical protein